MRKREEVMQEYGRTLKVNELTVELLVDIRELLLDIKKAVEDK